MLVKNFLISIISIVILLSAPANAALLPSTSGMDKLLQQGHGVFCVAGCSRFACAGSRQAFALCGIICDPEEVTACTKSGEIAHGGSAAATALSLLGDTPAKKALVCTYGCSGVICGQFPELGKACVNKCDAKQVKSCKIFMATVEEDAIAPPTKQIETSTSTSAQTEEARRQRMLRRHELSEPLGAGGN